MADQVFIQHRFTIEKDGKSYSDALVVPFDDYGKLSPEEIEAQKNERFDNWKAGLDTVTKEETSEDVVTSIDKDLLALEEQKQLLLSQKSELQAEIAMAKPVVKGGK